MLEQGLKPLCVFATADGLERSAALVVKAEVEPVVLSEGVFRAIADAESPAGIAAEIAIPDSGAKSVTACVFLAGVQDPSNAGAILRTAPAFAAAKVVHARA